MMQTPFNMKIVGITYSGKTYFLLKMLEKEFKNFFDYIFSICPTFEYNKTYLDWKYLEDEKFITIPCKQHEVDDCLKYIVDFSKGTNSLIILDDCAASQDVKNRTGELVDLAFSARHYGLSTIVITQKITSICLSYRENISKIIYFYSPNTKSKKILCDEFLEDTEDKKNI